MPKINVLIADDHPLMLEGIKSVAQRSNKFEYIFVARNGQQAIDCLQNNNVNFLITDISMPEITGMELIKFVRQKYKNIKILVISQFDDIQILKPLLKLDIDGFLMKSESEEIITAAINKILLGEKYFPNNINNLIIKILQNSHESDSSVIISLSKRETEVLNLIAQEKTNKDIANILFISIPTIETYRRILFKKFDVKNSVGLIKKAIELGFVH